MTEVTSNGPARRNRVGVVAIIAVIALAIVAGLALPKLLGSSGQDIFLESAASTGANPFTINAVGSTPTRGATSTGGATSTTDKTGLFGGTTDQRRCDPDKLVAFLETHRDKGHAWVAGLMADSSLKWSGGHVVRFEDIRAYVAELTPAFLAFDTRVTNNGFKDGKLTPHQSVLQKGTAVLVDAQGVPRARCACGNPLSPPKKVDHPHYKGHRWPGFGDQPPCAGSGCAATTTRLTKATTTTATTRPPTRTTVPGGKSTTTRHAGTTQATTPTTVTRTTSPLQTTTTRAAPTTSPTCSPNDPNCPGKP